jgi:lysophospholipase L1-like esterase
METHPKATIVFMTPLHRTTEDYEVNEIGLPRKKLLSYVEMIRRVCEYYALPVLDLYKLSGMQPAVQVNRELYMPDGLHPSNAGAEKIAKLLFQFILGL